MCCWLRVTSISFQELVNYSVQTKMLPFFNSMLLILFCIHTKLGLHTVETKCICVNEGHWWFIYRDEGRIIGRLNPGEKLLLLPLTCACA